MPRKLIYLINPVAGTGDKSTLKEIISRDNDRRKIDYEIGYTNGTGEYDFLKKKIASDSVTDVIICGGDGSINEVTAALLGIHVNVGIIPRGSGNGLARSAGIPAQISKALDVIFAGRTAYIDGFYINGQFSCMLSGIGFDAKVAYEFAKERKRGLRTYVKRSALHYLAARPYTFEIIAAGNSIVTEAYMLCIANSNQFGNNFTIAPRAKLNDGLLDVVIVKKQNKVLLPFFLLQQVSGFNPLKAFVDYNGDSNIFYFQTANLTVINTDGAPLHIDGDPKQTSKQFDIAVVPKAIRLIQPMQ